ncbi:hypothetical protein D3C80_1215070 [compost metagenome]
MAHARLDVEQAAVIGKIGRQAMRGLGLTHTGNVVLLALDRGQADVGDGRQVHALTLVLQQAARQQMLLEDNVDGLKIELLGQVQHRQVFVVELLVLLDPVAVAVDQALEIAAVGVDVLVLVHRHEAVELDEARIDPPSEPRIGPGHGVDHVRLEPGEGLLLGQLVGHRRRQAGVDGRAHEGHGGGPVRVVLGRHDGAGRQHRRSRLADADDVGARADGAQHGPDVVDVVVEVEAAFQHRHLAGVLPVADIDVVVLKEAFDRAAQQGGVVA